MEDIANIEEPIKEKTEKHIDEMDDERVKLKEDPEDEEPVEIVSIDDDNDLRALNLLIKRFESGKKDPMLMVYEAYLLGLAATDPFKHDKRIEARVLRRAFLNLGDWEKVGKWLFEALVEFGSFTPLMMIRLGRADRVLKYIDDQETAGLSSI